MIALPQQIDRSSRLLLGSRGMGACQGRGLDTRVAHDSAEFEAALHLVYQAYRETNLIAPNPYEMRITKYHLLPTTNIFLACDNHEVVGTLTLIRDGAYGLPMEEAYRDVIAERRARGLRMAEVSCLADAGYGKSNMLSVVVQLMSHMAQFALRHEVDQFVIAVHPHHVGFYRRFAGFEVIGDERCYHSVCDNPAVALAGDLRTIHRTHPHVHKRFFGKPFPEHALTEPRLNQDLLVHLEKVLEHTNPDCFRTRPQLPLAA